MAFEPRTLTPQERQRLAVIAVMATARPEIVYTKATLEEIIPGLTYSGIGPADHMDDPVALDSREWVEQVEIGREYARRCAPISRISRKRNVWSVAQALSRAVGRQVCTGALVQALLMEGFTVEESRMGAGGAGFNASFGSVEGALASMRNR